MSPNTTFTIAAINDEVMLVIKAFLTFSFMISAQTGITKELMNIKTQTESVGVSAKTLGALAESIGVSAADVGNQAGAIGEFIKNNYISLTDEQKAQLTTIAGSLKTEIGRAHV